LKIRDHKRPKSAGRGVIAQNLTAAARDFAFVMVQN
jgi:hypothetical protein